MFKKIFAGLTALTLLPIISVPVMAEQQVSVLINGSQVYFSDVQPMIVNNRTLVPVRAFAESVNAEVSWDDTAKTVSLSKTTSHGSIMDPDTKQYINLINPVVTITMQINNPLLSLYITSDDKNKAYTASYEIDTVPIIINNRTMLPARYFATFLGYSVDWNDQTKTVICVNDHPNEITIKSPNEYLESKNSSPVLIPLDLNEKIKTGINILYSTMASSLNETGKQKIESYLAGDNTYEDEMARLLLLTTYASVEYSLKKAAITTGTPVGESAYKDLYERLAQDMPEKYKQYIHTPDANDIQFLNTFLASPQSLSDFVGD